MSGPTAGLVLAGGLSSRMGRSKALLEFHGVPLYQHMINLLKGAGVEGVFISGDVPGVAGCLADTLPHQGPARALAGVMNRLQGRFRRVLVVPVDMPLLPPELLREMLNQPGDNHLQGHPLPLCLEVGPLAEDITSLQGLIARRGVPALACPAAYEPLLLNVNTPDDWQKVGLFPSGSASGAGVSGAGVSDAAASGADSAPA